MEHEYICGSFMWAGVDYIGESSGWPSKGWPSAPFDMCMSEKLEEDIFGLCGMRSLFGTLCHRL